MSLGDRTGRPQSTTLSWPTKRPTQVRARFRKVRGLSSGSDELTTTPNRLAYAADILFIVRNRTTEMVRMRKLDQLSIARQ